MPRYTYKCPECGDEVEEVHSIKEDPEIICGAESGNNGNQTCKEIMKRVPCNTSFKLKGLGWPGKDIQPNRPYRKGIDGE